MPKAKSLYQREAERQRERIKDRFREEYMDEQRLQELEEVANGREDHR